MLLAVVHAAFILGAWKLSGKTQSGWSIGLLHAITAEENANPVKTLRLRYDAWHSGGGSR